MPSQARMRRFSCVVYTIHKLSATRRAAFFGSGRPRFRYARAHMHTGVLACKSHGRRCPGPGRKSVYCGRIAAFGCKVTVHARRSVAWLYIYAKFSEQIRTGFSLGTTRSKPSTREDIGRRIAACESNPAFCAVGCGRLAKVGGALLLARRRVSCSRSRCFLHRLTYGLPSPLFAGSVLPLSNIPLLHKP